MRASLSHALVDDSAVTLCHAWSAWNNNVNNFEGYIRISKKGKRSIKSTTRCLRMSFFCRRLVMSWTSALGFGIGDSVIDDFCDYWDLFVLTWLRLEITEDCPTKFCNLQSQLLPTIVDYALMCEKEQALAIHYIKLPNNLLHTSHLHDVYDIQLWEI